MSQHGEVAVTEHRVESRAGLIASYVHTSPAPSLGRMAALVALETSTSSLTLEQQSAAKASIPIASPSAMSSAFPKVSLLSS